VALVVATPSALAQTPRRISYAEVVRLSAMGASTIEAARADERAAAADGRASATYPNPSVMAGSSTQAARLTVGVAVPLVVFGQRGAALRAGQAAANVVHQDTRASVADARASAKQAYVTLWAAERNAISLAQGAQLALDLEATVQARVEVGSAPAMELLRARSERLRAAMDAAVASELVDASASELCVWIGLPIETRLRATDAPPVPQQPPTLAQLLAHLPQSPALQRAQLEIRAAEARVANEQAQVRPALSLDLSAEYFDPTMPATNYIAQLGLEVPLFNQRGYMIERERWKTASARFRLGAERRAKRSALLVAYRNFAAQARRQRTLLEGVLPAVRAAAQAAQESYGLGRTPLVSVLEARQASINAELDLVATEAATAQSWIEVEHLLGDV
jgi:cobalt-zinc-cadmium efflux system outer membrane protein